MYWLEEDFTRPPRMRPWNAPPQQFIEKPVIYRRWWKLGDQLTKGSDELLGHGFQDEHAPNKNSLSRPAPPRSSGGGCASGRAPRAPLFNNGGPAPERNPGPLQPPPDPSERACKTTQGALLNPPAAPLRPGRPSSVRSNSGCASPPLPHSARDFAHTKAEVLLRLLR